MCTKQQVNCGRKGHRGKQLSQSWKKRLMPRLMNEESVFGDAVRVQLTTNQEKIDEINLLICC